MTTKTIKEITGHKKDSVFYKYVKISEEFKKLEMERTWDSIPNSKSNSNTLKTEENSLLRIRVFIFFVRSLNVNSQK